MAEEFGNEDVVKVIRSAQEATVGAEYKIRSESMDEANRDDIAT